MMRAVLIGVVLLASLPAAARFAGHPGATGSPGGGTCNRCHSPQTYDGLEIQLFQGGEDGEPGPNLVRRRDCFVRDESGQLMREQAIHTVPFADSANQFVRFDLVVTPPPESVPGDGDPGLYCPVEDGDPTPGACGASANAGIAIEVNGAPQTGNPVLRPASSASDMQQAGSEENPPGSNTEVNHLVPREFGGGNINWPLEVLRPGSQSGASVYTFYASANACNNNGQADPGDITTLTQGNLYFEYGPGDGEHTGPSCNESLNCDDVGGTLNLETNLCDCPEGAELDENGECPAPGCSHVLVRTTAPATTGLALFLLLGAVFLRKRRE